MIIPEIKMSEALPGKDFEYYLDKIEPYKRVSINTSPDFRGSLDMLREAKEKYPDKRILRKDFIMVPRQIDETFKAGADFVLLLAEYLRGSQLEKMIHHSYKKGIIPFIEINSYRKFSLQNPILVNSRDLNTGKIDRINAIKVCKRYKKEGFSVIYASGEDSNKVANQGIANYVLIGTAFMRETLKN